MIINSRSHRWKSELTFPDTPGLSKALDSLYVTPGEGDNLVLCFGKASIPAEIKAQLISNLMAVSFYNCKESKKNIIYFLKRYQVINVIDDIVYELVNKLDIYNIEPHLYNFAKALISSSCIEGVKLGITLIGVVGCNGDDILRIKELSCNEEYTLYGVMTLDALLENSHVHIWDIARCTHGWGRLNCIAKLKSTTNGEIKSWLLTDGCYNTVMNEVSAYTCAEIGDINGALSANIITDELFKGATAIIKAFVNSGSFLQIKNFDNVINILINYGRHARNHAGIEALATMLRVLLVCDNDGFLFSINPDDKFLQKIDELKKIYYIAIDDVYSHAAFGEAILSGKYDEADIDEIVDYFHYDTWNVDLLTVAKNPLAVRSWFNIIDNLTAERVAEIEDKIASLWQRAFLNSNSAYVQSILYRICDRFNKSRWDCKSILSYLLNFPDESESKLLAGRLSELKLNYESSGFSSCIADEDKHDKIADYSYQTTKRHHMTN